MAAKIYLTDAKFVIASSNAKGPLIGHFSEYATTPHPGSGKMMTGWEFDLRTWPSEDNDYTSVINTLTDPDLTLIKDIHFQSGIGNNDDCLVTNIEAIRRFGFVDTWAPIINHGYFYNFRHPNYLFSDAVRIQYVVNANLVSGISFISLLEFPKVMAPILCRTYLWDRTKEEYTTYKNFLRKMYFTGSRATPTSPRLSTWNADTQQIIYANIDPAIPEFVVKYENSVPPKLYFNTDVTLPIGGPVATGADLLALDVIGASDGTAKQIFHTTYSPIDATQTIQVFSYFPTVATYQEWTPRINTSLTHSGFECIVDTDMGTVQFGDQAQGDQVPTNGSTIVIRYSYTVEVAYEPQYSTEIYTAKENRANVNPIVRSNNRGFVVIKNSEQHPFSVTLYTDLPTISADNFGPLDIGNIVIPVKALVKSKNGTVLENYKVTFNILDIPPIGRYTNGLGVNSAFTNQLGIATIYYTPPKTIDDIGELIDFTHFSISGGNTSLTTQHIKVSSSQRDVYLYKVWKDDPYLGIPLGNQASIDAGIITIEQDQFYEQFFLDEGIYGPTGMNPTTGNPTGSPLSLQTGATWWEERHRAIAGLIRPQSYNRAVRNGRKQIVAKWDATALDPHQRPDGAFVPLQPTTITTASPLDNTLTYNGVSLQQPGVGDLDSYFVISPTTVLMKASIYNEVLDRTIESDIITIHLQIPPALNGTVHVDNINDIPASTVPYILNISDNGKILPLGFKIRQTGVTLASAVQGVTYIDINQPAELTITFNVDKLV